jgi:two-component system chemotaxis sensor kinase CheA
MPATESLRSLGETVRVDIRKLDELMNLVGELAIQREAVAALVSRLAGEPASARSASELGRIHKDLDRRLRELQAAVLEVRMVPLRQVFDKVSRVVRRLRVELGKDVRLEVQGADTELDKMIVEGLVDPLMHIVRNALDHAIEPPDERSAAGKAPQGCVRIEAFQRGNHVVVVVSDDGCGIDRALLRERAEALGLLERDQTLGEQELLDLVFVPGISTRREVTGTSGRGVGMDVVRTNIGLFGGVVDLSSVPGRGTTVSLTLPITLAIIPSLVVEVTGQRFAIPLGAIQETLVVDPPQIQRSEGRELLDLRGSALPLRRLCVELGLGAAPEASKQFAVVLGMGDARLGLLVDRLEGQQDAVIKPIDGPYPSARGIAGAADLGGSLPVTEREKKTISHGQITTHSAPRHKARKRGLTTKSVIFLWISPCLCVSVV